ncbi:hypothetical protein HK405_010894, partial [Cladochytrium tenue]
ADIDWTQLRIDTLLDAVRRRNPSLLADLARLKAPPSWTSSRSRWAAVDPPLLPPQPPHRTRSPVSAASACPTSPLGGVCATAATAAVRHCGRRDGNREPGGRGRAVLLETREVRPPIAMRHLDWNGPQRPARAEKARAVKAKPTVHERLGVPPSEPTWRPSRIPVLAGQK